MASSGSSSSAFTLLSIFIFFFSTYFSKVNGDFVLYSDPGQVMLPGQNFTYDLTHRLLPFGPYYLIFQKDCNLVRYTLGVKTWESHTSRPSGHNCSLFLRRDGELILQDGPGNPIWRSGVKSTIGDYAFALTWDSSLSIFGPELWSNTKKVTMSEPEPMLFTTDYIVYANQVTTHTFGILASYKNFRLVLGNDCNLVLEDMNTWDVLWETKTSSPYGDCFTFLDNYGEFFIKHNRREVLWRTGVRASKPAEYPNTLALVLRYDGRLMIYNQKIWDIPAPPHLRTSLRKYETVRSVSG